MSLYNDFPRKKPKAAPKPVRQSDDGWHEFEACAPSHHDYLLSLKPQLKDWLAKNPGFHSAKVVEKILGWRKNDVHRVAREFRRTFDLWEESRPQSLCKKIGNASRRVHCITLHPHFRMPHA